MRLGLRRFQLSITAWLGLLYGFAAILPLSAAPIVTNQEQMETYLMDPYVSPTNGLGSWIWADKTFDRQTCQFWRAIYIPDHNAVTKARLVMTVDNEFTFYLDGRELGRGDEWRELFVFDITELLTPGQHTLAVKAFNSKSSAGMLFGLRIELADGHVVQIKSDRDWRIVPEGEKRWEKKVEPDSAWPLATIIAPLFGSPWWTTPQNVDMMPSVQPIHILFWQTGWFQITLLAVCGLVILISLRLMAQLAFHKKERLLLQQERARIAREIHDDIGARMTQLVLHGELAQNALRHDAEAHSQLAQLCEGARSLLSTMDEILWAVNPKRDTLRDFASYVCSYAQEFLEAAQIQCLFEIDPEMSAAAFNLPLRRSLLMAIKEALNNAVKYSAATELRLQILWQRQRLVVVVQDNGRGFDQAIKKSERNGLTNMAQRMTELGGTCIIASEPGRGCRIEFSIPLKQSRRPLWPRLWNFKLFSERLNEPRRRSANDPLQNNDPTKC